MYVIRDKTLGTPVRVDKDGLLVAPAPRGRYAVVTPFPSRSAALKAVTRSTNMQTYPPFSDRDNYDLVCVK